MWRWGLNDSINVEGYDFTIKDFREVKGSNFDATQAEVLVSKDGQEVTTLYPEKRNYIISMMPMTEAAIDASLMRDVYVALGEPIAEDSNEWAFRIYVKPLIRWIWLGSLIMAFGALLSMLDRRYRIKKPKTLVQFAPNELGMSTATDLDMPASKMGNK